jgi:integrase
VSVLRIAAEEYLAMRRTLGFKLSTQGPLLMDFVGYCEWQATDRVTTEVAMAWAIDTPRSSDQVWWSHRLAVVRIFARHLQTLHPATEIPPADVLPARYRRVTPYLYSHVEVTALVEAAATLTPPLRGCTYQTLIGLLAVTGLRISEACRFDGDDVDLDTGVLTVRDSKFGRSRQVPIHASTTAALGGYRTCRDRLCRAPKTPGFFVSMRGTRLDPVSARHTFADVLAVAGIQAAPGRRRPRLHDLRHSFVVATLLQWHRTGVDVRARLPLLSTYLGHVSPASTYYYMNAVPELLALVAGQLQQHSGGLS